MRTLLTSRSVVAVLAAAALAVPSTASARDVEPPANDGIADAVRISEGVTRADTTLGATREPTDPGDLEGQHTVWYTYNAFVGAVVEIETAVENTDPSFFARFVVYRGTPGDLDAVAVSRQPDPRYYNGHHVARFPTVEDEQYYIGVATRGEGGDFSLTIDRAKRPSDLSFPDMMVIGSGPTGELFFDRGKRPRVRIRVATGFFPDRQPGRGPVTLNIDGGKVYKIWLREGQATFVLPKTRRGFSFTVDYPGTARIDPATGTASMIPREGS